MFIFGLLLYFILALGASGLSPFVFRFNLFRSILVFPVPFDFLSHILIFLICCEGIAGVWLFILGLSGCRFFVQLFPLHSSFIPPLLFGLGVFSLLLFICFRTFFKSSWFPAGFVTTTSLSNKSVCQTFLKGQWKRNASFSFVCFLSEVVCFKVLPLFILVSGVSNPDLLLFLSQFFSGGSVSVFGGFISWLLGLEATFSDVLIPFRF